MNGTGVCENEHSRGRAEVTEVKGVRWSMGRKERARTRGRDVKERRALERKRLAIT